MQLHEWLVAACLELGHAPILGMCRYEDWELGDAVEQARAAAPEYGGELELMLLGTRHIKMTVWMRPDGMVLRA